MKDILWQDKNKANQNFWDRNFHIIVIMFEIMYIIGYICVFPLDTSSKKQINSSEDITF